MLRLISTDACLCPCRALTLLVLVDSSWVLFIHGVFIACCRIYCSLMRWTMLDKPPRQSIVCGKTSGPLCAASQHWCRVWRMWFPRSFAPDLAKVCLCFALMALVILATTYWLHARSCLSYATFVRTIIVFGPFSSPVFPLPAESFQATRPPVPGSFSLAWLNSTTRLQKNCCRMWLMCRADFLTGDILLVSDLLVRGLQTPPEGQSGSRRDTFILLVTD